MIQQLRQRAPIVHNITNYVAMDLTANALLAIGARPIMSAAQLEMQDIACVADALLINIGTLDDALIESAILAGAAMHSLGKPIVLDPVGIQLSGYRMETAMRIIDVCQPWVIKGNEAEMASLPSCIQASPQRVLVTTGEVDHITDGERVAHLTGGSILQTRVTAMGCTVGAVIAACLAIEKDPFVASQEAMQIMNHAGEQAVTNLGLATYRQRFIDCLSTYA